MSALRALAFSAVLAAVAPAALPAQAQYLPAYPEYSVAGYPGAQRSYPYVRCGFDCTAPVRHRRAERARRHDHRAAEAPYRKHRSRRSIHTTRIVRDPPVVIEHRHVVDDPPRVIERRHYVEDAPAARKRGASEHVRKKHESKTAELNSSRVPRVIRAEAEVTILGPDRMSIRLLRKHGTEARAQTRR